MQFILQIAFFAAFAGASELPIKGLSINEKLGLNELIVQDHTGPGFEATLTDSATQIVIKATPLPSEELAKKKTEVDLVNLRNLYEARVNPYEGQLSDLVQCPPALKPKLIPIQPHSIKPAKPTLLVGGVSARKMFGACAKDQLAYWGGFFEFYHQGLTVEVRIFKKSDSHTTLAKAQDEIKKISENLFSAKAAP
jgi:hypothetical protein